MKPFSFVRLANCEAADLKPPPERFVKLVAVLDGERSVEFFVEHRRGYENGATRFL